MRGIEVKRAIELLKVFGVGQVKVVVCSTTLRKASRKVQDSSQSGLIVSKVHNLLDDKVVSFIDFISMHVDEVFKVAFTFSCTLRVREELQRTTKEIVRTLLDRFKRKLRIVGTYYVKVQAFMICSTVRKELIVVKKEGVLGLVLFG